MLSLALVKSFFLLCILQFHGVLGGLFPAVAVGVNGGKQCENRPRQNRKLHEDVHRNTFTGFTSVSNISQSEVPAICSLCHR